MCLLSFRLMSENSQEPLSVPVAVEESLSISDRRVTSQHAECRGLPCSVYPQQAKTLRNNRHNTKLQIHQYIQYMESADGKM